MHPIFRACLCLTIAAAFSQSGLAKSLEFSKDVIENLAKQARAVAEIRKLTLGAGVTEVPCNQDPCPVPVVVLAWNEGTVAAPKVRCQTAIGNITYPKPPSKHTKRVVWSLVPQWETAPPVPAGVFQFHETLGISLMDNPKKQIIVRGHGDGDTDLENEEKYYAHNKDKESHDTVDKSAVYVPFILYYKLDVNGKPDKGNPTLCGALDPKIINTP